MNIKQVSDFSPRDQMVQQQLVERGIRDARVLEAMRSVPREQFFPAEIRHHAYADRAAPIGYGQTISQPYIVAAMTQHLEIHPLSRILEIGTGSGYQTAVLARLGAEVYTIERVKPLLDAAFERLLSMRIRNVHYRYGDGSLGWPERAPYDRIMITAAAPELPKKLLMSQLADGGVAVLPLGPEDEQMLIVVRRHGDELTNRDVCPCRFVKLIGEAGWRE